jgi:hypothetical protein
MMYKTELPFKVEVWTKAGAVDRVLAEASNLVVARGAYDVAVALYPQAHITLRQGARVIAETKD